MISSDGDAAALTEGMGPRPFKGKPDATVAPTQDSSQIKAVPASPDQPGSLKPVGLFADEISKSTAAATRPPSVETATMSNEARKLQEAISAALAPLGTARPVAEVRESNEGLLISLTDDLNFGMFANASAEPTPGLVRALDKITPLISQSRGQVIVRGHTDGRAFRFGGVR